MINYNTFHQNNQNSKKIFLFTKKVIIFARLKVTNFMKKTYTILLVATCSLSSIKAQEKVLVFGSDQLNGKTLSLYEEKMERYGAKLIGAEINGNHRLMFVAFNPNAVNEQKLIETITKNEWNHAVYVKNVESSTQLQELGITEPKILTYFQSTDEKLKVEEKQKKQTEMPKEYFQDGKHFVKCEWANFYYEVTGNPEVDAQNYQNAKQKWVNENPKEYQNLISK